MVNCKEIMESGLVEYEDIGHLLEVLVDGKGIEEFKDLVLQGSFHEKYENDLKSYREKYEFIRHDDGDYEVTLNTSNTHYSLRLSESDETLKLHINKEISDFGVETHYFEDVFFAGLRSLYIERTFKAFFIGDNQSAFEQLGTILYSVIKENEISKSEYSLERFKPKRMLKSLRIRHDRKGYILKITAEDENKMKVIKDDFDPIVGDIVHYMNENL